MPIELVGGEVPKRIMLIPMGRIVPRDGRAPWLIENRAHADEVVAATRAHLGTTDLMLDYDHQSERAPKVAGQAKAAGWIDPATIEVGDDGIYGEAQWTSAARAALADREYRYLSPHFGHTKDTRRVTRIFNAALTNTPALEMSAVASVSTQEDKMDKIALALGLTATADEDAIVSAIGTLKEGASLTAIAAALQLADDASPEEIATAATAAAARPDPIDLAPIAAALGFDGAADVEQLATAAATAKASSFDPTKYVPMETHQTLIARVAKVDEDRALASVDAAIEAGKVSPANRDWAINYFKKDEAGFTGFVTNAPAVLVPGESDEQREAAAVQLSDDERAICARIGVAEEDYLKTKKELA